MALRQVFRTGLRRFSSKVPFEGDDVLVPSKPTCSKIDSSLTEDPPEIDEKLINHLERLSLVRFDSEQAVASLRSSIKRANQLKLVDVENVEPMVTVWEQQECPLQDDEVEDPLPLEKVLGNAKKTYEDYFVTPPGNVPLESKTKLNVRLINEWDKIGTPKAPEAKIKKRME